MNLFRIRSAIIVRNPVGIMAPARARETVQPSSRTILSKMLHAEDNLPAPRHPDLSNCWMSWFTVILGSIFMCTTGSRRRSSRFITVHPYALHCMIRIQKVYPITKLCPLFCLVAPKDILDKSRKTHFRNEASVASGRSGNSFGR